MKIAFLLAALTAAIVPTPVRTLTSQHPPPPSEFPNSKTTT